MLGRDCEFLAEARSEPIKGGASFPGSRSIIAGVESHRGSFESVGVGVSWGKFG